MRIFNRNVRATIQSYFDAEYLDLGGVGIKPQKFFTSEEGIG